MNTETTKIELNIAGQAIMLSIPTEKANYAYESQQEVNDLFDRWRKQFPRKTDSEILAMTAYQFATFYNELRRRNKALEHQLEHLVKLIALAESEFKDSECDI